MLNQLKHLQTKDIKKQKIEIHSFAVYSQVHCKIPYLYTSPYFVRTGPQELNTQNLQIKLTRVRCYRKIYTKFIILFYLLILRE